MNQQRIAAGALCALVIGCGDGSAEYMFGDSVRVMVERDSAGALSLVELALGPASRDCRSMKVDLAWKGGVPRALLARHRGACPV